MISPSEGTVSIDLLILLLKIEYSPFAQVSDAEVRVAGTYPCQMGTGVGKNLINEGCVLMRERGFRHMITDWRITNLASSTFWAKYGFKPIAYRMVRYIDRNWTLASFDNANKNRY